MNVNGAVILNIPVFVRDRIAGWIERAMEIIGCKGIGVGISASLAQGSHYTEIVCRWE